MGHINHINIRVVWFSWPIIKTPRIELAHPRQSHRAIFFTALGSWPVNFYGDLNWPSILMMQMSSIKWACWFGNLFFSGKSVGIKIHQQNQNPTNKKGVQRRFHPNQGCKHRRRLVGAIEMRYVWWFQGHFCNSDPWWGWYMTTTIPKWLLPSFNEDYPCAPQHNC